MLEEGGGGFFLTAHLIACVSGNASDANFAIRAHVLLCRLQRHCHPLNRLGVDWTSSCTFPDGTPVLYASFHAPWDQCSVRPYHDLRNIFFFLNVQWRRPLQSMH